MVAAAEAQTPHEPALLATAASAQAVEAVNAAGSILPPRLEGTFRLRDGRFIGFAEYGTPTGRPVLWFHGTPGGSRQIPPAAREAAVRQGLRVILLERPGIGRSTPHLYPSILGWAHDVGELADRLGLERFACVGLSGGGPYVLACAHVHAERMTAGAVLGGVAPARGSDAVRAGGLVQWVEPLGPLFAVGRRPLGRVAWGVVQCMVPVRHLALDAWIRISPPGDQLVFKRPEMREMFIDDLVRAAHRNVQSLINDVVLFSRYWGFSLRDLRVPIRFWHGDADWIVPLAHAERMAELVPDSELRIRHGESHIGALDAAEEIFDTLLELWPGAHTASA